MTSKEALENIIKFLQELEDNSILPIPAFSKYLKEIKVINKDLDKLEQLEDIEKELGIDLITLFKVLKGDNFYSKHPETGEVSRILLPKLYYTGRKWNIGCASMIFNEQEKCCDSRDCDPKDYGKSWALTKEELEK